MKKKPASPSATELEILMLLATIGGKPYGKELVERSGGALSERTIYVFLNRMKEKGFVTSKQETTKSGRGLPKRRYQLTAEGRRVMEELYNDLGSALAV